MSKTLDQMNCILDMGHFPWTVHLGASLNIVFSIWLGSLVFELSEGSSIIYLLFAISLVVLNVASVIVLRTFDKEERPFPEMCEMSFFKDQHRFATWVYAIAAANMFFWLTVSLVVFQNFGTGFAVVALQCVAFLLTYVPLWRYLYAQYSPLESV